MNNYRILFYLSLIILFVIIFGKKISAHFNTVEFFKSGTQIRINKKEIQRLREVAKNRAWKELENDILEIVDEEGDPKFNWKKLISEKNITLKHIQNSDRLQSIMNEIKNRSERYYESMKENMVDSCAYVGVNKPEKAIASISNLKLQMDESQMKHNPEWYVNRWVLVPKENIKKAIAMKMKIGKSVSMTKPNDVTIEKFTSVGNEEVINGLNEEGNQVGLNVTELQNEVENDDNYISYPFIFKITSYDGDNTFTITDFSKPVHINNFRRFSVVFLPKETNLSKLKRRELSIYRFSGELPEDIKDEVLKSYE